jgi:hypothetical protein
MSLPDDFTPIVDEQQIEHARGLLARRKQRTLPPVGRGYERVLIAQDGTVTPGTTAGSNYWAPGTSWAKVDMSAHDLAYEFAIEDRFGLGGCVATLTVTTRIIDSSKVVRRRTPSVKGVIEPLLREFVSVQLNEVRKPERESEDALRTAGRAPSSETIRLMEVYRNRLEGKLREGVAKPDPITVPTWIALSITSVDVEYDASTARYRDDLLAANREAYVIAAKGEGQLTGADVEIDLRERWRTTLTRGLSDPAARLIEAAAADPSPENIQAIAARMDAADDQLRAMWLEAMKVLAANNYDLNDPKVFTMVAGVLQTHPTTTATAVTTGPLPPEAINTSKDQEAEDIQIDEEVETAQIVIEPDTDQHWG